MPEESEQQLAEGEIVYEKRPNNPSRLGFETGQSEDEMQKIKKIKNSKIPIDEAIQVDKIIEEDAFADEGAYKNQEYKGLKKPLYRQNNENKSYLIDLESKDAELATCKSLIKNFKEMLYEKDIKFESLERDLEVNKSLAEALSQSNDLLNKNLENKEIQIENLIKELDAIRVSNN